MSDRSLEFSIRDRESRMEEARLNNEAVRTGFNLYYSGRCDYICALEAIVLALVNSNQNMQNELVYMHQQKAKL
jgi:hypothetical protein